MRGRHARKVGHSNRVLLASVVGRGVDIGGATELFDLRQALTLRRVQHAHQEWLQLDLAIHSVVDRLQLARTAVAAFFGNWLGGWLAGVCVAALAMWSLHLIWAFCALTEVPMGRPAQKRQLKFGDVYKGDNTRTGRLKQATQTKSSSSWKRSRSSPCSAPMQ